jgi:hypothetical protein
MNVAGFFVAAWRVRHEVAQTRQKSVVTLEGYRSVQSLPFLGKSNMNTVGFPRLDGIRFITTPP